MRFFLVRNLITFRCVPIVVLNALLLSTVEKTGNLGKKTESFLMYSQYRNYSVCFSTSFAEYNSFETVFACSIASLLLFFITAPEYLVANSHTTSGIGVFENCILSVFTCFSYFSRSWRCRQWSDKWWQLEGGRLGLASWHLDRPWILRPTYCHEFAATIRRRDPKGKGTNRKYFILSMFPQ